MLGGGQYSLIGNFIEQQFITVGNWHFGSAVSLVLATIVIVLMALIYKAEKRTNVSSEDEEGGSRRYGKRKKYVKVLCISLCLAFLYFPLLIMAFFSFNSAKSLSNFKGFSFRWYESLFGNYSY